MAMAKTPMARTTDLRTTRKGVLGVQRTPRGPWRATSDERPRRTACHAAEETYDCVVVGGGISGLCTAQALALEHAERASKVLVTEARERVGGNITSMTSEDGKYLWEEGPNSFQPSQAVLKMAVDSGLKDELVLGDPNAPRFVWWEGKLRPVPASPADLPFFDLMSFPGKIRAGLGAMGLRPQPPAGEETVEQFVKRNLGDEVFYRLIEPFCSGVYAGDPTKLSMKAAFGKVQRLEEIGGSIVGGSIKAIQEKKNNPDPVDPRLPKPKGQTVGSFRRGLKQLPEAISQMLGDRVKVNYTLDQIQKENGVFKLTYSTPEGVQVVETKTVVLTVPAYVAATLVKEASLDAADALSSLYYPPVGAVTLVYPKSSVRSDRLAPDGNLPGFGQLHPRTQGITTLGTIYSSSLFPDRCPDDEVMFLNYIGGTLNPSILNMPKEELVKQVDTDIRKMLIKEDAPAPKVVGVRVWPKAIPQFLLGHLETVESARQGIADAGMEGLFLGGNYVSGVALGKCVEGAYESAKEISEFLSLMNASAATPAAGQEEEAFFV